MFLAKQLIKTKISKLIHKVEKKPTCSPTGKKILKMVRREGKKIQTAVTEQQ